MRDYHRVIDYPSPQHDGGHALIDVINQPISRLAEAVIDAPNKFVLRKVLDHQRLHDSPG